MTTALSSTSRQDGFTLMEILITIIVASILGAMLVQFLGAGMTQSAKPVVLAREGHHLNRIVEKITADYKKLMVVDPDPLTTLKTHVENGNSEAASPYFGAYTFKTQYVRFNSGNAEMDTTGENRTLAVTLTVNRQSLAVLFTR